VVLLKSFAAEGSRDIAITRHYPQKGGIGYKSINALNETGIYNVQPDLSNPSRPPRVEKRLLLQVSGVLRPIASRRSTHTVLT
jgi:hypothetical protein